MKLCFFYSLCKSIAKEVFRDTKGRDFYVCSDCAVKKSYFFINKKTSLSEKNKKEIFFDGDWNEEERKITEEIEEASRVLNETPTMKNQESLEEKINLLEKTWNERNEKKWREKVQTETPRKTNDSPIHPPSTKQNYWNYIIAIFLVGCLVLVGIFVNKKKKQANKPLVNSTYER